MYQDKNQKEIKEKYEKIKQDCLQENIQKTKEYKLLRHKRNKDYIPEYKLELKNEDWKNKNIESVYIKKTHIIITKKCIQFKY